MNSRAGGAVVARFNPWPWAIIAFFVVAIAGTSGLIALSVRSGTELVAKDYYDQEIRFQSRVDQQVRTRPWEEAIKATYVAEGNTVRVQLPPAHASLGASGALSFYRPSAAGADRQVPLAVDAKGVQSIRVADWTPGLWKLRFHWRAGGEDFFAERAIVIGPTVRKG